MKQPTFCGRELLPLSVIEAARAGDPLAVERVLWYYEGYMDKLCTRTLYDLDGSPRVRVDEYMKRRLQSRLIRAHMEEHREDIAALLGEVYRPWDEDGQPGEPARR